MDEPGDNGESIFDQFETPILEVLAGEVEMTTDEFDAALKALAVNFPDRFQSLIGVLRTFVELVT